ncbi:MAG: UvrD-helicase domain-containing protein [Pirellulales bacterium]|nr:UvrD-helicase domain-containing protein [Pirellulales bacterium]
MTATKTNYTSEQQCAIETRNVSVALSAGAGCGKTFVLTERFLSHLQPASDKILPELAELHELIAITFTDRAAREMRDRIRGKCFERLQSAPADQIDYWLRLLRSLDAARISTIHAFCGALLRSHAVEARLDPRFAVIEQAQADTLLAELIDDLLRENLTNRESAAMDLAAQFGLDRLRELIAELVSYGRAISFEEWLRKSPAELAQVWDDYRRQIVLPTALADISTGPSVHELLAVIDGLGNATGELKSRCNALQTLLPGLPQSHSQVADLEAILQAARVQGAGSKKAWPDESLYERFKTAAERLRTEIKSVQKLTAFDIQAAEADAAAGLKLLSLAATALGNYDARKQELAWLDFNDLLIRARDLLIDPAHAELQQRLASQTRLLLVDEFQDTDPVQVELIKALCGPQLHEGKLFFVGDYKQSIYRFRGADPSVFRQLQRETPEPGRLPLTENFRSQPAILAFVNALFCEALSSAGDPAMQYVPLRANRGQVTAIPAVEFLWSVCTDLKKSDAGAKAEARRREAEQIARRIQQMLESGELLVRNATAGEEPQPHVVQPKDIAILFRALSDVQYYEDALRRWNIDYYLVGGHAFYAQQEIFDVVNLLRSLASQADEVALIGVLRSSIFSLTDETIYWLGQHRHGLAQGLFDQSLPVELTAEQTCRAAFAASTLRELRLLKDRLPIASLLNEAMQRTGYNAALLAEFMGERKLANLRKLMDQARAFDESGVLGLADFIVQLSEFVVHQPREPLAATHPEGTNVVRLMTIHQSKGLEFPVVFVPDMDRATFGADRGAVWNPQLGPLVKIPTRRDGSQHLTGLDLHHAIADAEDQAERLRLLYVATTRAADYLVLSSGVFDLQAPSSPWMKLLAERFDLENGHCLAILPDGYAQPEVKVHQTPEIEPPPTWDRQWRDLDQRLTEVAMLATKQPARDRGDQLAERIAVDFSSRRRFSVSRLSGILEATEDVAARSLPDEDEDRSPAAGGADLGTLVHAALSKLDYRNPSDVSAWIRRCAASHQNSLARHLEVAESLVRQFVLSARAQELVRAKQIHRELEFLLAWPPGANQSGAGECRYLQGFIDCIYQDSDGAWHLIDYKTNQISADAIAQLAKQYEMQLGLYALAIEKILGQPPVECVLYFMQPAMEHHFPWNDAARRQTIESINRAITVATAAPSTPEP